MQNCCRAPGPVPVVLLQVVFVHSREMSGSQLFPSRGKGKVLALKCNDGRQPRESGLGARLLLHLQYFLWLVQRGLSIYTRSLGAQAVTLCAQESGRKSNS